MITTLDDADNKPPGLAPWPTEVKPGKKWDSEVLSWLRQQGSQRTVDVVVLGPQGCGKTHLVAALFNISMFSQEDGFEVRVIPRPSLATLTSRVARSLVPGGEQLPLGPALYEFQLEVKMPDESVSTVELGLLDGPNTFFTESIADVGPHPDLRGRSPRDAAVLILCVDVCNPQVDLWLERIPLLTSWWNRETGNLIPRLGEPRSLPHGIESLRSPEIRPGFERVLVLLTKVDPVCRGWSESLRDTCVPLWLADHKELHSDRKPHAPPRSLGQNVDGQKWLEYLFGEETFLERLRSQLRPDSQLAVGLTSAIGFDFEPLASADDALARWKPFGLREMLTFLSTGSAEVPMRQVPLHRQIPAAERWLKMNELSKRGGVWS